ncbi:uncharacterized protein AMSG_01018 [Thecamonas trahens ATCC 50062]|uniref:Uncharacterized protein n=1 Tax=Thecamonas trahens ATCC 50062 TaxID=461836 RepID=A0A0L0DIR3_THETB|nr:hypothetical protein AMSG_01018 [Thecamonas trahens ATCC 50062]KNC52192.1 hypothetical protein AMSG_01018 [Thecamonas trahens ATCC 50062]|eukprot:XP_013762195.1 hypothetical protein AMSG_01018 [Thecamonas trahens ATCC 50062]
MANTSVKGRPSQQKGVVSRLIGAPVLALLLVLASTAQTVGFKLLGYAFGPFPFVILITMSAAFVPLFGVPYAIARWRGVIPAETRTFPLRPYWVIGGLNAANGILLIFANPHVPGVVQAVLAQAGVPMVFFLSLWLLRTKYAPGQYASAVVIVAGIIVSLVPSLKADGGDDSVPGSASSRLMWSLAFLLGALPASLASIYQERMFAHARVHLLALMFHSSVAQFVSLAFALPLVFIPSFGTVSPAAFGPHMAAAFGCLIGNDPPAQLGYNDQVQCSKAGILILAVVGFMLTANFASAATTKYASASFMIFVSTVVTPVSSFAFTFSFIMGSHAESLSIFAYIALVLLVAGIFGFRYFDVPQYEETELEPLVVNQAGSPARRGRSASPGSYPGDGSRIPLSRPMYIPRAGIITLNTADPTARDATTLPVVIPAARPHSYTSHTAARAGFSLLRGNLGAYDGVAASM